MRTYEKPTMTFAKITTNQVVAKNCWHNIANGTAKHFYWDTNGTELGYYEFGLSHSDCGDGQFATNLWMWWWEGRADEHKELDTDPPQFDHKHGDSLASDHPDFIYLENYGKNHFSEGIKDLVPKDS